MNLSGQWVGEIRGDSTGGVFLNIERGSTNHGFASILQYDYTMPAYRLDIEFSISDGKFLGVATNPQFFDHQNFLLTPADSYKAKDSNVAQLTFSKRINFECPKIEGNSMMGVWSGDVGTKGMFNLQRTANEKPQEPEFRFETWKEFRAHILDNQEAVRKMIFRGQWDGGKKLRSSFHRHGRYDLAKYLANDFTMLALRVNAISKYTYNANDPQDAAAMLNLAQHHGFPTPMLDWTKSPFIAAYFAFSPHDSELSQQGYARIFQFDGAQWAQDNFQAIHMLDPMPSITPRIMPAHNNPRAFPQQSVMMLTNLDDIEAFIRFIEGFRSKKYLTVFEVNHKARTEVLNELRLMGITSAGLFPDYEGLCRELRLQYFPQE
jgi:hypothetical protein